MENPTKPYHIRELSREIRLAPTSIKLHIRQLEKENLVKREKVGIYKAYKANLENENFRFYKKILNIIALHESGLVKELEKTSPDAITLFGSYARGEDTETSDIDIFLITREKPINVRKYEGKLRRKVQLFFSEDLNTLPTELFNNIMNGILLSGFIRWKT